MKVTDFTDYKIYINTWISDLPNNGHGEYRRISQSLNISTTMVSQVFKGEKHLSLELAVELTEYLGLSDSDSEYFLLLVEQNRAGSAKLAKMLLRQVKAKQDEAKKIESRLKNITSLKDDDKSIFYSNWTYVAVYLLTAIKETQDLVSISQKLSLPRNQTQKVIDFLLKIGLCKLQSGRLVASDLGIHTGKSSILVTKHHQNWRLQGLIKVNNFVDTDLFFTMPCAISYKDTDKVRELIKDFLGEINTIARESPSETVRCLNIDWFEI